MSKKKLKKTLVEKERIVNIKGLVVAHKTDPTLSTQRMLADEVPYLLSELDKLSLNEYQRRAQLTKIYPQKHALDFCSMKLASEAGEVNGKMAKRYRDDNGRMTRVRSEAILKELGDVLWYVAMLAYEMGYTLEQVGEQNLQELASRKQRNVLMGDGDNR